MTLAKLWTVMAVATSVLSPTIAAAAPYTEMPSTLSQLYVDSGGNVAFQLQNSFPSSVTTRQCPTADANHYGGLTAPVAKEIMAALLLAKAQGLTVTVVVSGCTASGAWYNVINIYL